LLACRPTAHYSATAARDDELVRAATAAVEYAAGAHTVIRAACEACEASYDDVKNTLKKWRKDGTFDAHVAAYLGRQPLESEEKQCAERKTVLAAALKAMKAGVSVRQAAADCQKQGVIIQKSALWKHKAGITVNERAGAPAKLPDSLVNELVTYIEAVRVAFRIPVFICQVRAWVQQMITGTDLALKFKDGVVGMDWVRYFVKHQLGGMTKVTPLEFNRAKWFTSKNVRKYYDMYKDCCLELGFAVPAPQGEYNPLEPLSQEIIVIKPERILEIDEARVTADMSKDQSGNLKQVKTRNTFDTHEAVVNKGGGTATIVGGSAGNGDSTVPLLIHAGAEPTAEEKKQGPRSTVRDPVTHERLGCQYTSNKKGGMTWDLMVLYVTLCIIPMFPDLSPENPIMLLFDGHGSHMTVAFILFCKGVGIKLLLKPPHTTHRLQTCDVYNFRYMMDLFKSARHALFASRTMIMKPNGSVMHNPHAALTYHDIPMMLREAYEKAFAPERNKRAWGDGATGKRNTGVGLIPFTKKVWWDAVNEENARDAAAARAGVTIVPYNSLAISNAPSRGPQHHSGAVWDGGFLDSDPNFAKCVAAEARVLKRKADSDSSAAATEAKRVKLLTDSHASALLALESLANVHEGDVSKLKVPQMKSIIIIKTMAPVATGNKDFYFRKVMKLLVNEPSVQSFKEGVMSLEYDTW
jgi:hypothetical protein